MKLLKFNAAIKDFRNAYRYNNKYYKAIIYISKCYLQILQPDNSVSELDGIDINHDNQYYEEYIKEVLIVSYYFKIFLYNLFLFFI